MSKHLIDPVIVVVPARRHNAQASRCDDEQCYVYGAIVVIGLLQNPEPPGIYIIYNI